MSYAILRIAKRSLRQARSMAAHALRERDTPNADPACAHRNRRTGASTAAEAHDQLEAMTAPLVKRRDAVRCVEIFVGMSPEAAQPGGPLVTLAAQRKYFDQALAMVAERFGGRANLVLVAEHHDETTPHLQILLAPIERDGTGKPTRLAANRMIGGPAGLRDLQDAIGAIGAPHGLRRGEKGSRARHTSVKAFYGAIAAAGTKDALPPRYKVPDVPVKPEPPGLFASAVKKAAYTKAVAEYERVQRHRERAQAANQARQQEIERLARLGLAVHGRGRRRLPSQLQQAEAVIEEAKVARQVIDLAARAVEHLAPEDQAKIIKRATNSEPADVPGRRRTKPRLG